MKSLLQKFKIIKKNSTSIE